MQKFNFYLDEKVTTWMRTNFSVEAESLEDARQKAVDMVLAGDTTEYPWEQIPETIEQMNPEDNGGSSTKEIFESNGNIVFINGEG